MPCSYPLAHLRQCCGQYLVLFRQAFCFMALVMTFSQGAEPVTTAVDDRASEVPQGTSASELPPPLEEYLGRRIAPTMHYTGADWLLRGEREQEEHSLEMLQNLGVKPGMAVCDMGCGNGFHALQLAQRVGPTGRVLAVDIQQEMLHLLQARAAEVNCDRIETILGEFHDPHLPENTLDLILCVDVYHEFSYPEQMLVAMRKALKPNGKLVLVEFREEDPHVPIKPLHKMSKQQVRKELEPNGFVLDHEYEKLPWQHMMFFRRAAASPQAEPEEKKHAP